MRESSPPTTYANVAHRVIVAVALVFGMPSCSERANLPRYELGPAEPGSFVAACDVPTEGCACEAPGSLVDCGELRARTDDYVTCMQGVRRCGDEGTWGTCEGNLVEVDLPSADAKKTLALGVPESCVDENLCDPLCRQISDTGVALTSLPEGLCSTAAGVVICPLCGYSGTGSRLPYADMAAEWQRVPATCSTVDDRCSFDMECVLGTCQSRTEPCASTDQNCSADLTLGKPCIGFADPNNTYHIPLCNRGATAVTTGTVRIGVDSRSANVAACVSTTVAGLPAGFPNSGYVEVQLSAERRIEAGGCIDVNVTNSLPAGLDLTGSRALVANYDGALAECNNCNNGSALIVQLAEATSSTCVACVGPACADPSQVTATLNGVLYDPAGRNPVPNAVVYVPITKVASFVDGVACDTCDSVVSGTPLTWAKTDPFGKFTLSGVPSE